MGCSSSQYSNRKVYKKHRQDDYSTSGDDSRGVPDGQESFHGIDPQNKSKTKPKPKKPKGIMRSMSSEIPSGTDITMLRAGSEDDSKEII